MVGEQRIMVRAEVLWDTHSRDSAVEHSTQGNTVHITSMHAEANDAPCELIHDHKHPVQFNTAGPSWACSVLNIGAGNQVNAISVL